MVCQRLFIQYRIAHRSTENIYRPNADKLCCTSNEIGTTFYEKLSCGIKIEFGIDKCRTENIIRKKWTTSENFTAIESEQISPFSRDKHYKYLGIMQRITTDHKNQKKCLKKELMNRLSRICKSILSKDHQHLFHIEHQPTIIHNWKSVLCITCKAPEYDYPTLNGYYD